MQSMNLKSPVYEFTGPSPVKSLTFSNNYLAVAIDNIAIIIDVIRFKKLEGEF